MQRNAPRLRPEELPDPQQAVEQKKKELDEEFQRFLKKNSQLSVVSAKENRLPAAGLGFKSLLDEVLRDNGHKAQKEAALALRQQQAAAATLNPGRVAPAHGSPPSPRPSTKASEAPTRVLSARPPGSRAGSTRQRTRSRTTYRSA